MTSQEKIEVTSKIVDYITHAYRQYTIREYGVVVFRTKSRSMAELWLENHGYDADAIMEEVR